jgi:hypothetical protein
MGKIFVLIMYFFYFLGACLIWIAKGFKTALKDELSEEHHVRNSSIAIIIFAIIFGIFIYFNNRI